MRVMNFKEATQLLNCSDSVLRSLIRKKEIPHFRLSSKICFTEEKLLEWILHQEEVNMKATEQSTVIR